MASLDLDLVRHALKTAQLHGCKEVEIALEEDRFHAKLSGSDPSVTPAGVETEVDADAEVRELFIKAPLVGYYGEGDRPLHTGDKVEKGDIVGVIVALGLANDVESTVEGKIAELLVHPGDPVEFGQPLARLVNS